MAADALTLDDLITYGRLWEEHQRKPVADRGDFHLTPSFLDAYLSAANSALEEMRDRQKHKAKRPAGRPRGGGMGEQVARLRAHGVSESDAVSAIALQRKKTPKAVRRATPRKKPPR